MNNNENEARLTNLLQLRLAVAAIGEKAGWWQSDICSARRLNILKQLFPKTWRLAAFSAVSESAKLVHRDAVAHRAQHLFRFQTEIEQDLRRYLNKDKGKAAFDAVFSAPETPEQILGTLASKQAPVSSLNGAVSLGIATPENIYGSVPKMAALYLAASKGLTCCFPYFLMQDEAVK